MLIVDSNEYSKIGNKIDLIFKNIEYEVQPLKVGDYVWSDSNICIERKTVMDYVSSLQSGHLFSQLKDMQVYTERYLFISGDFSTYNKMCHLRKIPIKFTVDMRIGSLCSVAGHYGVKIIQFDNEKQLLKGIIKIQEKVEKAGEITGEIERTTAHKDNSIRMYLAMKGMGLKRCEKLKEIYPNYLDFFADVKNQRIENLNIPKNIITKTTITFLENDF